jgi:hypothetical protein
MYYVANSIHLPREWTRLADTNHARANPVLVPYRGCLYLFGGEGETKIL